MLRVFPPFICLRTTQQLALEMQEEGGEGTEPKHVSLFTHVINTNVPRTYKVSFATGFVFHTCSLNPPEPPILHKSLIHL